VVLHALCQLYCLWFNGVNKWQSSECLQPDKHIYHCLVEWWKCPPRLDWRLGGCPTSQNISKRGDVKKGVSPACVKWQPTSTRHAFSNASFFIHSTWQLLLDSAFATARAWWCIDFPSTCFTCQAVSLIFSLLCICFQTAFIAHPCALACTSTICPSKVSVWLWSCFSLL